jgi:hypothetical protein
MKIFKIVMVEILILLMAAAMFATRPQVKISKKFKESNQDLNLAEEYKNFNELYFLNQLPKNTRVEWANLEDDLGQFFVTGTPGIAHILIDRKGNPYPKYVRAALLHEMCHEKVDLLSPEFDEHGHNWQGCMVDLAVHGAFHDIW